MAFAKFVRVDPARSAPHSSPSVSTVVIRRLLPSHPNGKYAVCIISTTTCNACVLFRLFVCAHSYSKCPNINMNLLWDKHAPNEIAIPSSSSTASKHQPERRTYIHTCCAQLQHGLVLCIRSGRMVCAMFKSGARVCSIYLFLPNQNRYRCIDVANLCGKYCFP